MSWTLQNLDGHILFAFVQVERLDLGALVSIRGVGRVKIVKIVQVSTLLFYVVSFT